MTLPQALSSRLQGQAQEAVAPPGASRSSISCRTRHLAGVSRESTVQLCTSWGIRRSRDASEPVFRRGDRITPEPGTGGAGGPRPRGGRLRRAGERLLADRARPLGLFRAAPAHRPARRSAGAGDAGDGAGDDRAAGDGGGIRRAFRQRDGRGPGGAGDCRAPARGAADRAGDVDRGPQPRAGGSAAGRGRCRVVRRLGACRRAAAGEEPGGAGADAAGRGGQPGGRRRRRSRRSPTACARRR